MKVKVINKGHQPLPAYATPQSAGLDLRANLESPVVLQPMERRLIPTGDYRGEVGVLLINLSHEPFTVNDGERIAQMVVAHHEQAAFEPVEVLDETERGAGGYGHTGMS